MVETSSTRCVDLVFNPLQASSSQLDNQTLSRSAPVPQFRNRGNLHRPAVQISITSPC